MDNEHEIGLLLDRLNVLRNPSDLDLLIFFARHPRSLLASEQLSAFLGYGVKEMASSLDLLLDAKLISRRAHPSHSARMYVFEPDGESGEWLPLLLRVGSTRDGRLAMIWALRKRSTSRREHQAVPDPLRFPDRRDSGSRVKPVSRLADDDLQTGSDRGDQ